MPRSRKQCESLFVYQALLRQAVARDLFLTLIDRQTTTAKKAGHLAEQDEYIMAIEYAFYFEMT